MSPAPRHELEATGRRLELGDKPLIMGIVNASPDSFYDGAALRDLGQRIEHARALASAGADVLDIGGESGVTSTPPVDPAEEIARVCPLIERLASELDVIVSVDTHKPAVARAAIAAGAAIVNDPSGLREPDMARAAAESGAALVLTHTRARPKQKLEAPRYADVVADAKRFLGARVALATSLGVRREQLLLCPGPDLGKSPAQTIELLRRLPELHDLGHPLLLAVSRKDFVGALLARPPRDRLAGTLAAVAQVVAAGAHVVRVHDVEEVRDFLTVSAAISGEIDVDPDLRLAEELRLEPAAAPLRLVGEGRR
jgi:dihydropteroate synthase